MDFELKGLTLPVVLAEARQALTNMDIKLSRFCTPKGSNQAPAYTSEIQRSGNPATSQETNRTNYLGQRWTVNLPLYPKG